MEDGIATRRFSVHELHLAGAAQMTGHPTVVAGLAAALGLAPVPGARPVGSA